ESGLIGGWYIATRDQEAIRSIESTIERLRYTPSLAAHYTPAEWFTNRLTLGADGSRPPGQPVFPRHTRQRCGSDPNRSPPGAARRGTRTRSAASRAPARRSATRRR